MRLFSCKCLLWAVLAVLVLPVLLPAQLQPPVGIRQHTPAVHAFINARIVTAPGNVIERGTLVIRDGMIVAVGAEVKVPADARVWDLAGMSLYPGLIDSYSDVGMPKKKQPGPGGDGQGAPAQQPEARGVKHWNSFVLSSQKSEELFSPDDKAAEKLRGMGFTTALVVPQKGIFRGASALVDLGEGAAGQLLVKPDIAQHVAFETSRGDEYPNSLMGSIALIRQTFIDAQWYQSVLQAEAKYPAEPRIEAQPDLAALDQVIAARQPVLFEASDESNFLRAAKIAKEFSLKLWVRGSGSEYRRLDAIKATGASVILPVNYPDAPAVQTPEEALNIELRDLRYWDEAPENPKRLHDADVTFALTTANLKDASSFVPNVRKAIERGLAADDALAALTTVPAKLFGVEQKVGSLAAGKIANFVIADGDLFGEKTKVWETWVDGNRYIVKQKPEFDPRGTWHASLRHAPIDSLSVTLKGEVDGLQGSAKVKGKEAKLSTASVNDLNLTLQFSGDSAGMKGIVRLTGTWSNNNLIGNGELADGTSFQWSALRTAPFKPEPDTAKPKPAALSSSPLVYPANAFGRTKLPSQPDHLLVRNATLWTCTKQGKLEKADLLIERGKILNIGQHLTAPPDAVVIDGTGKHITPGLIDCHSHSAADGGVNETGHTMTAEVRIGDIISPDDITIYRELAGGLTVANVLHGSANPIGGQNQVIKLRWGALPEEMKFEGAQPGIKFALGENPKQSNWGEKYQSRYPQTRQGVEQIIRDEFRSALDYEKSWQEFRSGKKRIPPRRDLQAEAVLEVVKGTRLVHAHSYRQDEIEMLMRVAEEFGFRVATFQHILEGYKVADQMAKHGAGGSSFSDWWAYKFEVYDAIPYNGALMHDAGVVVSYNSDSDELARHLNTEAAKAVKYGGVSEEEALKFVTINPAKQLRIDNRVGSLEPGKDGDFVLWSGSPLSTYSICDQTWIDGKKYFDRDEDRKMNDEIRIQRAALVQKVMAAKKGSGGGSGGSSPSPSIFERGNGYSCHDEETGKGR